MGPVYSRRLGDVLAEIIQHNVQQVARQVDFA
jgi:hypothetical protein